MKNILFTILLVLVTIVATNAQPRPRIFEKKKISIVEQEKQKAKLENDREVKRRNKIKADYINLRTLELKESLARLQHLYGLELCDKDIKCADKFRKVFLIKNLDSKISKQKLLIEEIKREKRWRIYAIVPMMVIK